MQYSLASTLGLVLAAAAVFAQQPQQPDPGSHRQDPTSNNNIDDMSTDVTAPALLPLAKPVEISTDKCKKKYRSTSAVELSLFVTSDGKPLRIWFIHALGNDLDERALDIAASDRFNPAMRKQEPAAVWQTLTVEFESCREDRKNESGNNESSFRLLSQPIQTLHNPADTSLPAPSALLINLPATPDAHPYGIGGGVSAPKPLFTPEARYSDEARKKRINGACFVSLIVDVHGMPQSQRITRSLGYGLDENAIEAIKRYRFKPALKGGFEPVPVRITVEVNFRLY